MADAQVLEAGLATVSIGAGKEQITLKPVTNRTGSTGFLGSEKVADGTRRYQVTIQVTLIGSKPEVGSPAQLAAEAAWQAKQKAKESAKKGKSAK